jgi:hypothetical protein
MVLVLPLVLATRAFTVLPILPIEHHCADPKETTNMLGNPKTVEWRE